MSCCRLSFCTRLLRDEGGWPRKRYFPSRSCFRRLFGVEGPTELLFWALGCRRGRKMRAFRGLATNGLTSITDGGVPDCVQWFI